MDLLTLNSISLKDKLFIVSNDMLFPLEISSNARFNASKILSEYKTQCELNGKKFIYIPEIDKIKEDIKSFKDNKIEIGLNELLFLKSYTREDIENNLSKITELTEVFDGMDKNIYTYILSTILPFKLEAFRIGNKIRYSDYPVVENTDSILSILMSSLLKNNLSHEVASIIIYLIYYILHIDMDDKAYDSLINIYCILNDKESSIKSDMRGCIKLYLDNERGLVEDISNNGIALPDEILRYVNNIWDTRIDIDFLYIPDKNKVIEMNNDIYHHLHNIHSTVLEDYVGKYKNLSFTIPESVIGYILYNDIFPISKVIYKNGELFTIAKSDNDLFVLFNTPDYPDRCFGLSIVPTNDERKLLKLEIPRDVRFQFSV